MPQYQNIITVIPDRFAGAQGGALGDAVQGNGTKGGVRRPTRGISLKKETFATLQVIKANNTPITLVDAGSPTEDYYGKNRGLRHAKKYTNFLLQQVQEDRMEKSQIIETFGEPFIFLFGERPRMMSFSGVLINTFDFNWEAEWWFNYENYMRGTRCVENDARVFLSFDTTLVSGYILSSSAVKVAEQPNTVQFSFQMFVTTYANYSKIGDPNAFPGWEFDQVGELAEITSGDLANGVELGSSQFRPKLLTGSEYPQRVLTSGNTTKMVEPTLEAGLKAQLSIATKAWSKIRDTIVTTTTMLSNKLNGGGVRVPVGFEGSMEFDEPKVLLTDPSTKAANTIRYTTFDDNRDEYVGVGDHYRSSQIRFDNVGLDPETHAEDGELLSYDLQLVNKAREVWRNPQPVEGLRVKGALLDEQQLGPVASFLTKKGVGMQLVAMNKAASQLTPASEIFIGGVTRFANSLPNPYTVTRFALENKL